MIEKRQKLILIFSLFLLLILFSNFVSASWFSDFWQKITGRTTHEQYGYLIVSSSPSNLNVYINGNYANDKTTTSPIQITANVLHEVAVKPSLSNIYTTKTITVAPNETKTLNFECANACASGEILCVITSYQTCGNYDTDSCLEWSTAVQCA
ncbi:MAG: hypothetical protein AABX73_04845, partial [Nanoarchaeota archaeon]